MKACDILNKKRFKNYVVFLETINKNPKSRKLSYVDIDPVYLKDCYFSKRILEISETKSLKTLWISSSLYVIINRDKTINYLISKIGKINDNSNIDEIISTLKPPYMMWKTFFGGHYMPILSNGKTKLDRWNSFSNTLRFILYIANTIDKEKTPESVQKQLQQRTRISGFYSNHLVSYFSTLTHHFKTESVICGPGSKMTLQYLSDVPVRTQKQEVLLLKEIRKNISSMFEDLSLYDVENHMCEFQKVYDIKNDCWKPELKKIFTYAK